ncbi:MAG: formate dehydrogenase subunit delta [Methylophilaceae bacterium]|nr:formate dehydrogenase subunit delta [Methylophilaceae bacterium]
MTNQQLVTMANQIGAFFKSYPDQTQANKDIGMHLNRYWALAMRQQIVQYVKDSAGAGLELNVIDAIKGHVKL